LHALCDFKQNGESPWGSDSQTFPKILQSWTRWEETTAFA
jgi:hypothetical protein